MTACSSKPPPEPAPKIVTIGIPQPYPTLPADLRTPVALPALKEGQDARSALAQNRAALKQCRAEQLELVAFYDRLAQSRKR